MSAPPTVSGFHDSIGVQQGLEVVEGRGGDERFPDGLRNPSFVLLHIEGTCFVSFASQFQLQGQSSTSAARIDSDGEDTDSDQDVDATCVDSYLSKF